MKKYIFLLVLFIPLMSFADDSDKLYSEYYVNGKWVSYTEYVRFLKGKVDTFCSADSNNKKCQDYCVKYRVLAEDTPSVCSGKKTVPATGGTTVSNINALNEEKKRQEEEAMKQQQELEQRNKQIQEEYELGKQEIEVSIASQNETMGVVEKRNVLVIFFVGSGYKNIETLKSEKALNGVKIKEMQDLLGQAAEEETKNSIKETLNSLQEHQEKVVSFIASHENNSGIFWWILKMFE